LYFRLSDGRLLDPSGQGIPDIKERILRFVGKPEDRLNEDSLRLFRFYRFLSKGFTAAPKDLRAVRTLFKDSYTRTDPTRVQQEIEKMIGL
jgi:poly(A) polymerase